MKIEVIFFVHNQLEDYFYNRNVVVIDVLRATSTIITALANGAKTIIPASSVEEAVKIAKNLERSTYLLCGERHTKIIDGFDLGNSPLEFSPEKVEGKKIILTSTNGTKVFEYLRKSKNVLIASTLNVSAVSNKMMELDSDWSIICSGRDGFFDSSDAILSGLIIKNLNREVNVVELNDAGKTSLLLYEKYEGNILKYLKDTDHGKILIANGFEKDLDFIAQVDKFPIVASFTNNYIGILK